MFESMESAGPPTIMQAETDFAEFHHGIISKLYDLKCRQISTDVKTALRDMRTLKYVVDTAKRGFFSYKVPAVKCAYMYAYSVLHSVMLYTEFSNYLKLCEIYTLPILDTELLNICCIGGGPGTEAVAICKSINDFISESSSVKCKSLLEVKVTVVDKLPHWKREENAVINAVNDKSNILHSENMILHSEFMKADILKPFHKNLEEKIKEANIVTIIKIGNHVQEKTPEDCLEDLENMVKNVVNNMSDNSCLLMLDTAGGKVFYGMTRALIKTRDRSIFKKSCHIEYSLDQKTLKDFSDLLKYNQSSKYHPSPPTGKGKVSSCLWIKNVIQTSENMQRKENPESENKQPKKKKFKSKKMKKKEEKPKPESKEASISGESSENPCLADLLRKENPVSENKQPKEKKIKSKKMKMKAEKPKPESLSKEVSISGESSENPCLSDLQSKENPVSENKQPKEKKIKSKKNEEENGKTETC